MKRLILSLAVLCTACSLFRKAPDTLAEKKPENAQETQQQILQQMQNFSFRLLSLSDTNENYVISPFSVQMALGMLLNGAHGETAQEIARTMGMGPNSLDSANSCFQSLMQTLPHLDNTVTLNIGNALFANRSVPLKEPFRQVTAQYYEAEAENLDFTRTKESAGIINAWCKQKTNGLIPKMLDETNPEAIVYLLNAVYFNGKWKKPFTPSQTKSKTFTNESGTRCEVPMMIQTASFRYGETAGMQCLCLPFGKGSYNMYILLPKQGVTLSGLMEGLNAESWNTFKGKLQQTDVNVWLPKFEIARSTALNALLRQMGMDQAFKPYQADFSNLSDKESFISNIRQKALIRVFEEGAEAAAVTGIEVGEVCLPPPPIPFHADHPFLFLLTEEQHGLILFAGRYHGTVTESSQTAAASPQKAAELWQFQAFKRPGEFDPDEIAEEETKDNSIYVIAEEVPMFPGDFMAMERFLSENIRYPQKALKEGLEGTVVVELVVEKDGSLTNIRVIRGVAPCLDEEALRVINMMPKWKPARQHNRIVRSLYRIPVPFTLPSKEKE